MAHEVALAALEQERQNLLWKAQREDRVEAEYRHTADESHEIAEGARARIAQIDQTIAFLKESK